MIKHILLSLPGSCPSKSWAYLLNAYLWKKAGCLFRKTQYWHKSVNFLGLGFSLVSDFKTETHISLIIFGLGTKLPKVKTLIFELELDPPVGFEYIILAKKTYLEIKNFFLLAVIKFMSIHSGQLQKILLEVFWFILLQYKYRDKNVGSWNKVNFSLYIMEDLV